MIELRVRLIPLYKMDDNRPVSVRRVLQFRTQALRMGNGFTTDSAGQIHHQYERPMGMTWSEWKDVPEVQLDADYAPCDATSEGR